MELETLVVEVLPVTLANLPDDVIREIIRVAGPEEEESLRLVSILEPFNLLSSA